MNRNYIAYIDGSSRGNPGPASAAFHLSHPDGRIFNHSIELGIQTNNIAEYSALVLLLKHLKSIFTGESYTQTTITVKADSQLVVNQMKGKWKVKNQDIKHLKENCEELMHSMPFLTFVFEWVPREENNTANYLAQQKSKG